MSSVWQAAVLSQPYATLLYKSVAGARLDLLAPGMRVLVPLGRSLRVALLLSYTAVKAVGEDFELKSILWPLERHPCFTVKHLELVRQLAARQLLPLGQVVAAFLPQPLRNVGKYLLLYERPKPRRLLFRDLATLLPVEVGTLEALWRAGQLKVAGRGTCTLCVERFIAVGEPPWPLRPAAVRQLAVLDYLFERGWATRRQLIEDLGPEAGPALAKLLSRKLAVVEVESRVRAENHRWHKSSIGPNCWMGEKLDTSMAQVEETGTANAVFPSGVAFCLNESQEQAMATLVEALATALTTGNGRTQLLFGITGSGKTVLYLELAAACLIAGRSVLLLSPEVALAASLYAAAASRFPGCPIFYYHGYQAQAHRADIFITLSRRAGDLTVGEPVLVVGTRSALFLPLPQLGLVVLDEEHDASFKQDSRLPYQAKEVAWFRANQAGALLVLGSATPDLKTFYAARSGVIPMVRLDRRVGESRLPEVELVDIRQQGATKQLLVPGTLERLKSVVAKGEQALILLNRRGYAPLMCCLCCGQVAQCRQCAIGLTYHKRRERLVCHYCGAVRPFPITCDHCGSCHYLPIGAGTERIEESLAESLAVGTGVLRLDQDVARKSCRLEAILAEFSAGRAQVLIGTQMLSKGHHFPDVTLVIAADGDLGLNLPDYRAAERTFQLIVQVSGRSGRGKKPGAVLVQTRLPEHYCWEHVRRGDYEGFYEEEVVRRKRWHYPPFVKLGLIRLSYPLNWEFGNEALAAAGQAIQAAASKLDGIVALGPASAPLPLLAGRKRFHCLLKASNWLLIRQVYRSLLAVVGQLGELRYSLDLDPMDML